MADEKAPKPAKDPEAFPVAEEAPVPKGVPDDPAGRAAMMAKENAEAQATATLSSDDLKDRNDRVALMASENAEGHATATVDDDDRQKANERAALLAQEGTGIQIPDATFRKTM